MARLTLYFFLTVLLVSSISARAVDDDDDDDVKDVPDGACKGAGVKCSNNEDCCAGLGCNEFAGRCSLKINPSELQDTKNNLVHHERGRGCKGKVGSDCDDDTPCCEGLKCHRGPREEQGRCSIDVDALDLQEAKENLHHVEDRRRRSADDDDADDDDDEDDSEAADDDGEEPEIVDIEDLKGNSPAEEEKEDDDGDVPADENDRK